VSDELNASDLWVALTALPRPHRRVPFPRNLPTGAPVGELAIWPLSQEEQMAANAEADRFTKKLLKDPQAKDQANLGYHHTYANETAVQVLFRACRNPDDVSKSAFPSPSLMRQKLSTDEIGVLFNQYCTVAAEIGPIVAYLTKEERESFITRLADGGSAFPFDSLSWEQQRTLVSFMASQLLSCWTVMCSLGSPPDVNTFLLERLQTKAEELKAATATQPQESDPSDAEEAPTE
jgi:hypothetical protein